MDREQMIEQRAKANNALFDCSWYEASLRIARAEIEREGRLVDEMNAALAKFPSAVWAESMRAVVAAYEAEFAPPQRTVEQIAADVVAEWKGNKFAVQAGRRVEAGDVIRIPGLLNELAAALKRAEGERHGEAAKKGGA